MFAVCATAVMPYSDDGASGEGLLLSCVETEEEAVRSAIQFMQIYQTKMFSASCNETYVLYAKELCENTFHIKTFTELAEWFKKFYDNMLAYVSNDGHYNNPSNVLNLIIKNVFTNTAVLECFS
jgi:hypothetical protein